MLCRKRNKRQNSKKGQITVPNSPLRYQFQGADKTNRHKYSFVLSAISLLKTVAIIIPYYNALYLILDYCHVTCLITSSLNVLSFFVLSLAVLLVACQTTPLWDHNKVELELDIQIMYFHSNQAEGGNGFGSV